MAETLRDQELDRARRLLARGEDPEQVLVMLARGLTNKLIHSPTSELKRATAAGHTDLLRAVRPLLGLAPDAPADAADAGANDAANLLPGAALKQGYAGE